MNASAQTVQLSRWPLILAAVLAVAAAAALWVNAAHNGQYEFAPVRLALPGDADGSASASFVADRTGAYELELRVDWASPSHPVRGWITEHAGPSDWDLRWRVTRSDEAVAAGDARGFLYLEFENSLRRRLHNRVLGIAPYERIGVDRVSRGVGRFEAEAGRTYDVSVTLGKQAAELAPLNPRLLVRVDHVAWQRHYEATLGLGRAGIAAGLAALVCLLYWGIRRLRRRGGGGRPDAPDTSTRSGRSETDDAGEREQPSVQLSFASGATTHASARIQGRST